MTATAALCLTLASLAASPDDDLAAIAEAAARSTVRVEYTLRFDRGEAPRGGWFEDVYADGTPIYEDLEEAIDEERTADLPGWVISDTRIVSVDPMLHPRFIEAVHVRWNDRRIPARRVAVAVHERAVMLELDEPLAGAASIDVEPGDAGPWFAVSSQAWEGEWITMVAPMSRDVLRRAAGESVRSVPLDVLIVDRQGRPARLATTGHLPADGWRAPPSRWSWVEEDALQMTLAETEMRARRRIARVSLGFRSPKRSGPDWDPYAFDPQSSSATQLDVTGVVVDRDTVLILAMVRPQQTARLDRIRVFVDGEPPRSATFAGSLRDYGAIVARLDEPIAIDGSTLSRRPLRDVRRELLYAAEVSVKGEQRIAHHAHDRIVALAAGWRRQVHAHPAAWTGKEFLFDRDGALVAFPVVRRRKVAAEERWGGSWPLCMAGADLAAALDDLDARVDPNNIPLSEVDEQRLAWLGVELQGLDTELARISGVSDRTNDGETGAMVTFVYPDSPADAAGIETGDILLRLHAEGQPRPIDVSAEESMFGFGGSFPWEQLDEIPEQYFDQIPTPWPSVESGLNRTLTDLGVGTGFALEIVREGDPLRKDMTVTLSPVHYEAAPRHEAESVGLTLRDLTYEARRYFQRGADEAGAIVSMVKAGSRASVAGIRPYEIITHVNDEPVTDAAACAERIDAGGADLRLTVVRMRRSRVVRMRGS